MSKQLLYSASEADEISNVFLKTMSESFVKTAVALTQICWRIAYFFIRFCRTHTVTMRKSEKSNYSASEIWKSIVLLSTVSKIIETVTAQYLQQIAEQYHMLPEQQMREQENHSAETALNLLTNQMQTIWNSEDYVISLLTLDITEAFNHVLQKCLMYVLRVKEISAELTAWICT